MSSVLFPDDELDDESEFVEGVCRENFGLEGPALVVELDKGVRYVCGEGLMRIPEFERLYCVFGR